MQIDRDKIKRAAMIYAGILLIMYAAFFTVALLATLISTGSFDMQLAAGTATVVLAFTAVLPIFLLAVLQAFG